MVVAAIFSAVVVVFMVLDARLKYPEIEVEALAEFASIGAFSQYSEVHEQNARELPSRGADLVA